jgi:hypothetical protein
MEKLTSKDPIGSLSIKLLHLPLMLVSFLTEIPRARPIPILMSSMRVVETASHLCSFLPCAITKVFVMCVVLIATIFVLVVLDSPGLYSTRWSPTTAATAAAAVTLSACMGGGLVVWFGLGMGDLVVGVWSTMALILHLLLLRPIGGNATTEFLHEVDNPKNDICHDSSSWGTCERSSRNGGQKGG